MKQTDRPLSKPQLIVPLGHVDRISTLACNDQYILSGGNDSQVKLWNWQGRELHTFAAYYVVRQVALAGDRIIAVEASGIAQTWNLHSGEKIAETRPEHTYAIGVATVSGNGKYVCTTDKREVQVRETLTNELVARLDWPYGESIRAAVFTTTDQQVVLWPQHNLACTLNLSTGEDEWAIQLEGFTGATEALRFSRDGRHVAFPISEQEWQIWETAGGRLVFRVTFPQAVNGKSPFLVAPGGDRLLTGIGAANPDLWELPTGRHLFTLTATGAERQEVYVAAFHEKKNALLTGLADQTGQIRDLGTGDIRATLGKYTHAVKSVVFSEDKRRIRFQFTGKSRFDHWAASRDGGEFNIEARTMQLLGKEEADALFDHSYSPGEKQIATLEEREKPGDPAPHMPGKVRTLVVRDAATGAELYTIAPTLNIRYLAYPDLNSFAYSPDGAQIAVGDQGGTITIHHAENGEQIGDPVEDFSSGVKAILFFNNKIIAGLGSGEIKIIDAETRETEEIEAKHPLDITSLALSSDDQFLLTSSVDNTFKILRTTDWQELAQFIPLGGREWVVTTPAGLFDASPQAMQWMHYAVNNRDAWSTIELDQLKDRYYEPGLLTTLLELDGAAEGLRDVSAFEKVPMYPETDASIENHTLVLRLRERDGGIGRVSLLVNNKEVFADENEAQKDRYTFNLQDYVKFFLPPGQDNHIGIQVYNRDGWLKSPVRQLPYQPLFTAGKGFEEEKPKGSISLGKRKKHQPRLFGIVVGTAKYKLPRLVLNFPDKDAFYIKQALENAGRQLFGEDRVDITLLSTNTEQADRVASKTHIQEAFTNLATKASSSDVLIVYLSGHGITREQGDRSHFYYITRDTPSENFSDPAVREAYTVSSEELTAWMKAIPALKQVLIVDACQSGTLADVMYAGQKALDPTQVRALERMKDRTGMFVLSGSPADKKSYESLLHGQGLLTYSLLLGMKNGKGLRDDCVDVVQLFQYSLEEVQELAKTIRSNQTPVLGLPKGAASFDIGIVREGVTIPLEVPRPVFVRSSFQEEQYYFDVLKLSQKIDDHYRRLIAANPGAGLVFVDRHDFDKGYAILGRYRLDGDQVRTDVQLFRENQSLGNFTVNGRQTGVDQLVKSITNEVDTLLRKQI